MQISRLQMNESLARCALLVLLNEETKTSDGGKERKRRGERLCALINKIPVAVFQKQPCSFLAFHQESLMVLCCGTEVSL